MRLLPISAVLLLAPAASANAAGPVRCDTIVAGYNAAAGHHGVPDILRGWSVENAAGYRFRDAGAGGGPQADSGIVCNPDGSLERFEFTLTWTGDLPLAKMAAAQLATETISALVAPDGRPPALSALQDMALHNAEMLNLASQAEWSPTGDGYEAYASVTRTAAGGAVTYAIRRQR